MLENFWQDLRNSVRALRRTSGFTAAAVVTLALGIGANTAMFSVVYGVLLRPLPYRDPGRLVLIEAERDFADRRVTTNYSLGDLDTWRTHTSSFESIALAAEDVYALATDEGAGMITGAMVSGEFFQTLDGEFALGRPLGPSDDQVPAAVISERLWRSRFASSTGVLGTEITLTGQPYTIVGVAASSFQSPNDRTDVWLSAGYARTLNPALAMPGARGFNPVARLRPEASIERAHADAAAVSSTLARAVPTQYQDVTASVVFMQDRLVSGIRPALRLLFAAVGLVLLVACVNVANLLLARNVLRARETAIRLALGASRTRLVRQALSEAFVLAVPAAAAGAALARLSVDALRLLEPAGLPRIDTLTVNTPVLVFAASISVATAGLAALFSALLVPRRDGSRALHFTGEAMMSRRRRVRSLLVVGELAVTIVLLVGAVLLGRSFVNLLATPLGVSTENVVAGQLNIAMGRTLTDAQQVALVERVVSRIGSLPSVQAAGIGNGLPPNRQRMRVQFEYPDVTGQLANHLVQIVPASPDFLRALQVPIVRGRHFTDSDVVTSPAVQILSASAARTFFGGADPIGRTLPLPGGPVTIVGVVGDVKYGGLDTDPRGVIYRPFAQAPFPSMFLVARTATDPAAAGLAISRAIAKLDPQIMVSDIRPLDEYVQDAAAQPRFRTAVLGMLALLALGLAAIGLYGLVSHAVSQRTGEIGVRLALGAGPADVTGLVIRDGMALVVASIAVGVPASFAAARLLQGLLFGVAGSDPATYVTATLLLATAALVACYIPARRAARVDPMIALRAE